MSEIQLDEKVRWAHQLWFKYEVLTHFFRYAAWLERRGYFIEPTASGGDLENWTIHLVDGFLLAGDENFALLISQAPLRAVVLAGVLQRNLDETNDRQQVELEKRLQMVTDQILVEAQEALMAMLKTVTSTGDDDYDFAIRLLLLLGTESQLASLPIRVANFANEPHTNSALGKLGAMKSLEELNLSQTLISREGTGFLANLSNLCKLDLSDTKVMSSSLTPLRSLTRLEELNLSGTQVNDSALASLAELTGLTKLDISDTALVASKDALEKLLPNCQIIVD